MVISLKKILHVVVFILVEVVSASGQPKYKVEFYTTEQGLSHQAVTTLLKDREGFMWFGTWDGINRFDGHSFLAHKSSPGDLSQLGNDRIDQTVEDQSGHLWIQAYDKQIYRFDKRTEQFEALSKLFSDKKQKVLFNRILFANDGLVWFGCFQRIMVFFLFHRMIFQKKVLAGMEKKKALTINFPQTK